MEQNLWGNRLKAFSWRIDVKTKARHIEQLNQPAAIMELQLSASNKDTSEVILHMDYGNEFTPANLVVLFIASRVNVCVCVHADL